MDPDGAAEIVFFLSDHEPEVDKAAMQPLADIASDRGHEVRFTEDYGTNGDMGVYCHGSTIGAPDLSVRMFHGIDDAYARSWSHWKSFDLGILPGQKAAENWRDIYTPNLEPRLGVVVTGWPKADYVTTSTYKSDVVDYASSVDMELGRTILYAPTKECKGKVRQFVEYCGDIADTLLIKHPPYKQWENTEEYDTYDDLRAEFDDHQDLHILDRQKDIWMCLGLADILVSDQSSVLYEALLTDTIPVSVTDWPTLSKPDRVDFRTDFVLETSVDELKAQVERIDSEYDQFRTKIRRHRDEHYSFLGQSAEVSLDCIEAVLMEDELPVPRVEPEYSRYRHAYWMARAGILQVLPDQVIDGLANAGIHDIEQRLGRVFR